MESTLDKPWELEALDGGGMLSALSRFPESCRDGIEAAESLPLDALHGEFRAVVVAGVGGSAIGGHLLRDWLLSDCPVSIHVSRGYHLPRFVDGGTLVFAVSYSGNTAETLSAFREALERRCPLVAFTSGGTAAAAEGGATEGGPPPSILLHGDDYEATRPRRGALAGGR